MSFCMLLVNAGVNINSASKKELMSLKGIGEKTAIAIMQYRKGHPFKYLSELTKIKGVGKKKLEKLKGKIEL